MTTQNTHGIVVTEEAWTEIKPTSAFLHVRLIADRLFSGKAALQKAEELRKLIVSLSARDIPDDAVSLEGASLDVSSGLFTRSSSVTYRVRIHVKEIERIADALDAVAECKKATLDNIDWDYPHGGEGGPELLAEAAKRALIKAERLAAALGVSITKINAAREEAIADHPVYAQPAGGMAFRAPAKGRLSIASEIGGLDLAPSKQVGVRVHLECDV
jgi:uncharacterized protein YggE